MMDEFAWVPMIVLDFTTVAHPREEDPHVHESRSDIDDG